MFCWHWLPLPLFLIFEKYSDTKAKRSIGGSQTDNKIKRLNLNINISLEFYYYGRKISFVLCLLCVCQGQGRPHVCRKDKWQFPGFSSGESNTMERLFCP